MKYLFTVLFAALSAEVIAEEVAEPVKSAEVEQVEQAEEKPRYSLDRLWNETATGNELKGPLINGTPSAEFMLGYEYSDLDDPLDRKAAHALISRIRLNYQTGDFRGFDAFVQAQYVGPISNKHAPENPNYDTVADPEAFRFHQAYLGYTGYDSHARIGAQEIILDNQRFIGNVGWRFNAQSFNGGMVKNNSIDDLTIFYAYTDSINEIDGETNYKRQYHLLNGEYKLWEDNQVAAFAYLQRNDASSANPDPVKRLDTYGARFWGKNDIWIHNLMLAAQRDAYYGYLSGMADMKPVDIEVGVECISGGSDPKEQFQTLNGTAHAFNGWADQFLGTGGGLRGGLVDLWVKGVIEPVDDLKLIGVYHYFNTARDTGNGQFSGTYGNEIDFMAKYPVTDYFDVLAAMAYYIKGDDDVTNPTNDETVFWLRGTLYF